MTVGATSGIHWIPVTPVIPADGWDDWGGENDGLGRGRLGSLILTGRGR